jgi:hypothetical protein
MMPKNHTRTCEKCWYKLEGYWEMKKQIAYLLNELIKLKQQLEELQKEFNGYRDEVYTSNEQIGNNTTKEKAVL